MGMRARRKKMSRSNAVYSPEEKKRVDKIVTDNYKLFLFLVNLVTKGQVTDEDDMFSGLLYDFWRACAHWDPEKGSLSTLAKIHLRKRYYDRRKWAFAKEGHAIRCQSLDAEMGEDGTLYEYCADKRYGDRQTVDYAMAKIILDALRNKIKMTDRQRMIMGLFYKGYTQTEIAQMFGITRQGVSDQYNAVVEKLQYVVGKKAS
jgi:RNA polymerase sigma factor (sigma-70 family)